MQSHATIRVPPLVPLGLIVVLLAGLAAGCAAGGGPPAAGTAPGLRLGAPAACIGDPACVPGLARVYGVDLSATLVRTTAADGIDGVRQGRLELAMVRSTSPATADPGLVTLADDRQMMGAGNLLPVYRRTLDTAYGPGFAAAVGDLSALLTTDAVRALDGAVEGGATPAGTVEDWLGHQQIPGASKPHGPTVVVGAMDGDEDAVLAQAYGQYLQRRGYAVTFRSLDGWRAMAIDAVANGDVDLVVDSAAPLLDALDGSPGSSPHDLAAAVKRIDGYLAQIGARTGRPAPAIDEPAFVTTRETSDRLGLHRLSDLARAGAPTASTVDPTADAAATPSPAVEVRLARHQVGMGDGGPAVTSLQRQLKKLGFAVAVTGTFDEPTRIATQQFQARHGLSPDGVVGAATEVALADPGPAQPTGTRQPTTPGDGGTMAPPRQDRVLYLTFDDGPSASATERVLALLDRYHAKATFFVRGDAATRLPDLLRQISSGGHAIGDHTFTGRDLRGVDPATFELELRSTADFVGGVGGTRPRCMRPPWGATDTATVPRAQALDLQVVLWDVDPQDWRRPGASTIASTVIGNVGPGRIIRLHDGGGNRDQTVEALGILLPALTAQGWTFASLPGC